MRTQNSVPVLNGGELRLRTPLQSNLKQGTKEHCAKIVVSSYLHLIPAFKFDFLAGVQYKQPLEYFSREFKSEQ
eukprot:4645040-Amphidinium_carterae.1